MPKEPTIAILYIGIGNYTIFWKDFFLSCEKYFIPEIFKEYYVFTDADKIDGEKDTNRIHRIYQKNIGWPGNSLYRYHMFLDIAETLQVYDYIFFFNANTLFFDTITTGDFLPQPPYSLVTTLHPRSTIFN